tara:strand:+ start:2341 stop:2892 length:552 start_codon:yes stop_codon:yes gene_type:complete
MSKNSFKKEIQERYKGRGNTWVKVIKNTSAYEKLENVLKSLSDCEEYNEHISREGFAWVRFARADGTANEPLEVFEVRYRGSKEDHPDCLLTVSHDEALEMPLLGNTPVKLQLEVKPDNRKIKEIKIRPKLNVKQREVEDVQEVDITKRIEIIKEATLKKPSNEELESWYEFLKLNDLYEENV